MLRGCSVTATESSRGMQCVPQWLTANVRPGGAPPDSENLNLDLARLDVSGHGERS